MSLTERILISSKERDNTKHPNSNQFRISLKKQYKISEAFLTMAQFQTTDYVINGYNNSLSVEFSSSTYICSLTQGSWSAANYASQLQTDLQTSGNWSPSSPGITGTWTVTYNSNTNKFTITSGSSNTQLNFNISSLLAEKLGFNVAQTSNTTSHTSNNVVNMNNSNYYDIIIPELTSNHYCSKFTSFATLYNSVPQNEQLDYFEYLYKNKINKWNTKHVVPQYLTVEIRDENNNLVELNNSDFLLEITLI